MDFNILQWNAQGLSNKFDELKLLLNQYNPKVTLIQETKLFTHIKSPLKNFTIYRYDQSINNFTCGGTAIFVHNSVDSELIPIVSNLQVIAVRIKSHLLNFPLTICSIYIPPVTRENKNLFNSKTTIHNIIKQLPKPFIIGGDFNAHHSYWGSPTTDHRGQYLEQILIDQNDLVLLNNGNPTFFSHSHKTFSHIDLSFISNNIAKDFNWNVLEDLHQSDHFPILISKKINDNLLDPPVDPIWLYKKADWNKYQSLIDFQKLQLDNQSDINEIMLSITKNILNASHCSIPKFTRTKRPVPWWCKEIKDAIKNRKKFLCKYKKSQNINHYIEFKKWRAISRRLIIVKKNESWSEFVSSINTNINTHTMYSQIKKINGKNKFRTINSVSDNNNKEIRNPPDIANTLAVHYQNKTSDNSYNHTFLNHKLYQESLPLDYNDEVDENYNTPFSYMELEKALKSCKSTAVGTDLVSYPMLKNLPKEAKTFLLEVFNFIWSKHKYPSEWSKSVVIPILKPNKDPKNCNSYRPITLINCCCKIFERMINFRLTWYLEKKKILSQFQNGSRQNRSTMNSLLHFEDCVTRAFANKQYTLATFLDIEGAFEKTWRRGILNILSEINIGGHILHYLDFFLNNNTFQVKVNGNYKSSFFHNDNGIKQGSSLSCVLFNIALSRIESYLPVNTHFNLYIDDLVIFSSHTNIQVLQDTIQKTLNNLVEWTRLSGFSFSADKSVSMIFHRLRSQPNPTLILDNKTLKLVHSHKWLGMHLDSKLSWKNHVSYTQEKLLKSINLLKMLNHPKWGLNRVVLKRLFTIYCRPITDYGSCLYQSAKPNIKSKLNSAYNTTIRLISGALRSSPLISLYTESSIPPLDLRYTHILKNIIVNIASNSSHVLYPKLCNLCQDDIHSFGNKPKPTLIRAKELNLIDFDISHVFKYTSPHEPWIKSIKFYNPFKNRKSNMSNVEVKALYNEHRQQCNEYIPCFTDGSKSPDYTGFAYIIENIGLNYKLNPMSSVFTAEIMAIHKTILFIINDFSSITKKKFIIYSDSRSSLEAIQNPFSSNPFVNAIKDLILFNNLNISIKLAWIPSHMGLSGNENADKLAKDQYLSQKVDLITKEDIKTLSKNLLLEKWNSNWLDTPLTNKLRNIKETTTEWITSNRASRREEIVLTRLRIGHTFLTHLYLFKQENPPICDFCQSNHTNIQLTIKHIFLECTALVNARRKFNIQSSLRLNLGDEEVAIQNSINFLREIDVFSKI